MADGPLSSVLRRAVEAVMADYPVRCDTRRAAAWREIVRALVRRAVYLDAAGRGQNALLHAAEALRESRDALLALAGSVYRGPIPADDRRWLEAVVDALAAHMVTATPARVEG